MCLKFIISDDVAKTMLSKLANFEFGMRIWEKVKVLCQWVGCGSWINKERMMSCVGTKTTLVAPTYLIHKHIKLKEKLHFFLKKKGTLMLVFVEINGSAWDSVAWLPFIISVSGKAMTLSDILSLGYEPKEFIQDMIDLQSIGLLFVDPSPLPGSESLTFPCLFHTSNHGSIEINRKKYLYYAVCLHNCLLTSGQDSLFFKIQFNE